MSLKNILAGLFVLLVVNGGQLIRGHCAVLGHYHNITHITQSHGSGGEAQSTPSIVIKTSNQNIHT